MRVFTTTGCGYRCLWVAALLALGLAWPGRSLAADASAQALEYQVKGGYLFHFIRLVEWPENAQPGTDRPFIIGVIGDREVLEIIKGQMAGKFIGGHPLQVQPVAADNIGSGCHVLFVTHAAQKSPPEILAALHGSATLLVGEDEGFAQNGGTLNFFMLNNSVKFEANPAAADRAHLNLGSQLLKLARIVRDLPGEKK